MRDENKRELQRLASEWRFPGPMVERFTRYVQLLEDWSQRINLISRNDLTRIVSRHIRQSLELAELGLFAKGSHVLDLGSGAGFPGIPLKIFRPDLRLVLVESKRMKALFLKEVVEALGLADVQVLNQRVEEMPEEPKFDIVTARAVGRMETLWRWASPLLKERGLLIVPKGQGDLEEVAKAKRMFSDISIRILPARSEGLNIVIAEKTESNAQG